MTDKDQSALIAEARELATHIVALEPPPEECHIERRFLWGLIQNKSVAHIVTQLRYGAPVFSLARAFLAKTARKEDEP